jgi:hypothetical protein
MTTRVLEAPEPIITPADVPGDHESNDARIAALIAAAQEDIDGPTGWVGRAFGVQTLEATIDVTGVRVMPLPYPPIIEVLSAIGLDANGAATSQSIPVRRDGDGFALLPSGFRGAVKVIYRAGYDGEDPSEGGTGPLPERVRQAIILAAQHAASVDVASFPVRSEEVEGVGTTTYTVSGAGLDLIKATTANLLNGLRVIRP